MASDPRWGPRTVCIVSAVRTPLGAFQGALSSYTAPELGSIAIRGALDRAGLRPEDVDEVLLGNVISANLGQAPATQASLGAGLPPSTPCTHVNKVCSSGLKAVMLAATAIMAGQADVVVAGGFESMSNAPHYMPAARRGLRLGDGAIVDGLVKDGLWDPYSNSHMGSCAELCADRYAISRQMQDEHALQSHQRAVAAAAAGHTLAEVVPVPRPGTIAMGAGAARAPPPTASASSPSPSSSSSSGARSSIGTPGGGGAAAAAGSPAGASTASAGAGGGGAAAAAAAAGGTPPSLAGTMAAAMAASAAAAAGPGASGAGQFIWEDEGLAKMDPGRLPALKPYFRRDGGGSVTAGNASPMTDGAAALVVASYEAVQRLGLPLLAVVRGFADAQQAPEWFTTAPAAVVPRALRRAGVEAAEVDYWEVNEAFSVVDLANRQLLGLPADRVNAHGGSVALGHPIGASGARILVTLLNVLRARGGRLGCAAICNGGGGASGVVVELVDGRQGRAGLGTAAAPAPPPHRQSQL
ncbi:hypothetical protein HYH02_009960 [Chlamydomonas schloesseri]|uniref:Acetyl-CoA C-acetyltransferase n=1 Tax=Chlamydomonas schloesseri TaxID=2026947 RepID=A0A835T9M5_9CHLO|nr:hypothetical protein HYH02_009960 [Chlamydomonas schloesseri]|eukprot:KAG2441369.1 hypothetical protein HYH02_009960 [Chlamydomonas schloesseri]